jgi:hypothetical protein
MMEGVTMPMSAALAMTFICMFVCGLTCWCFGVDCGRAYFIEKENELIAERDAEIHKLKADISWAVKQIDPPPFRRERHAMYAPTRVDKAFKQEVR